MFEQLLKPSYLKNTVHGDRFTLIFPAPSRSSHQIGLGFLCGNRCLLRSSAWPLCIQCFLRPLVLRQHLLRSCSRQWAHCFSLYLMLFRFCICCQDADVSLWPIVVLTNMEAVSQRGCVSARLCCDTFNSKSCQLQQILCFNEYLGYLRINRSWLYGPFRGSCCWASALGAGECAAALGAKSINSQNNMFSI